MHLWAAYSSVGSLVANVQHAALCYSTITQLDATVFTLGKMLLYLRYLKCMKKYVFDLTFWSSEAGLAFGPVFTWPWANGHADTRYFTVSLGHFLWYSWRLSLCSHWYWACTFTSIMYKWAEMGGLFSSRQKADQLDSYAKASENPIEINIEKSRICIHFRYLSYMPNSYLISNKWMWQITIWKKKSVLFEQHYNAKVSGASDLHSPL